MYGLIPGFLRGVPEEPRREALPARNPRGERGAWRGRPHTDKEIWHVRQLVETTRLTYGEISARTGVGRASICRWKQDGGWARPEGAPIATDAAPSARASARMKARTLHRRAQDIAGRILDELERDPEAAPEAIWTALEMLKAAKLARMPKRRRPRVREDVEASGAAEPAGRRAPGRPKREPELAKFPADVLAAWRGRKGRGTRPAP